MNLKTLSDLWYANKNLEDDFKNFKKYLENYKNQKLINSIMASKFWNKPLEEFSPDEREEAKKFIYENYSWLERLVEYYND